MPDSAIRLHRLEKTYRVPVREAGLKAAVRSLFRRQFRQVEAVRQISFSIEPGEIVGFLGANGAGKTTTLKMLSGLLHPTGGEVDVLGFTPSRRERAYLRQITLVMGNRNQLAWDIPALDSFDLNRAIYRLPEDFFKENRDELIEMMGIGDLVTKPVRNLSLGERMKVEILGSLLHRPRVLFLDEPTIGLDVSMQRRIRAFLKEYNRRYQATIMLTSHYMADVEALCERVIVIHKGEILYDGGIGDLVARFTGDKRLLVTLDGRSFDLSPYGTVVSQDGEHVTLSVPKKEAPQVTARILADLPVIDLTIEDPSFEDVVEKMFAEELVG